MKDYSVQWIGQAEYDLVTAKAMQQTQRYLYVGFMCQQAIEKGIKAIISKQCIFPQKSHNLLLLAETAQIDASLSQEQSILFSKLNQLYLAGRYPDVKQRIASELNQVACANYIAQTEEVLRWIKTRLSLSPANTQSLLPKP